MDVGTTNALFHGCFQ